MERRREGKEERKERHGQSRGNESGLLLQRVSKFPMRVRWERGERQREREETAGLKLA